MLWVRTAGVGPWRHTGQPHFPHQSLHPFPINAVTGFLKKNHHPATAVKWVPGVFLIYQVTDQEGSLIDQHRLSPRIDRGTGNSRQDALPDH